MDVNPEIAARIEGRLERLGLAPEEVEKSAGLAPGSLSAVLRMTGSLPRGNALRRLAVALDVDEAFILGLEPGDLVPPELLEEAQGELGLLAPDEDALLRNYRRLDIPTRAAVGLVVARAAGPEPEPVAEKPKTTRRARRGG